MSTLLNRISTLIDEINGFNLGNCGPSDDPDKQTAYVYGYKDLIKRFFASVKRIENPELQKMVAGINTNAESIYDAYDLRAEVQGVLDFLEDYQQTNCISLVFRY
jgi:hypothetical protein